jgi:3-oxoadipate enol-lactonase
MRCLGNDLRMTVNNIKVCYSDEGPDDAPVIILIHGFPFNKTMWDVQVDVLKESHRVIAYDIRGHGNTESGKEIFSIDLFSKDLIAMMDDLEIERATLCGLSMGGYIALNAVENHPERFEALVLSDTQCTADSAEAKEKRSKTIESIKETGVETFADNNIKNLFAPESLTTKLEETAKVKEMIINTSPKSLCNTLLALAGRRETCSTLQEINVPVLIMVGKEDKITPVESAKFLHDNIQGSSLKIIQHAGHLPNIENPDSFNYQLLKFADKIGKNVFCLSDTDGN